MASYNPYHRTNSYQFQQSLSSAGHFNQFNGGWNALAAITYTQPPASMIQPNSVISSNNSGSTSSSSEEDDWEPVQTDYSTGNKRHPSVSSRSSSVEEEEEWILDDDGRSQQGSYSSTDSFSPQVNMCSQFFTCEESSDEGFTSQEDNASWAFAGQNGCDIDERMDNEYDTYCFADDIGEIEMTTPFVKQAVKRDWRGNPVFQDDWDRGASLVKQSSTSNSSFSVNGGEEGASVMKRRCDRV